MPAPTPTPYLVDAALLIATLRRLAANMPWPALKLPTTHGGPSPHSSADMETFPAPAASSSTRSCCSPGRNDTSGNLACTRSEKVAS